MVTSGQVDGCVAERGLPPLFNKTETFVEFLNEYGENAEWEEWLAFLQERPELEGFDWARGFIKAS